MYIAPLLFLFFLLLSLNVPITRDEAAALCCSQFCIWVLKLIQASLSHSSLHCQVKLICKAYINDYHLPVSELKRKARRRPRRLTAPRKKRKRYTSTALVDDDPFFDEPLALVMKSLNLQSEGEWDSVWKEKVIEASTSVTISLVAMNLFLQISDAFQE